MLLSPLSPPPRSASAAPEANSIAAATAVKEAARRLIVRSMSISEIKITDGGRFRVASRTTQAHRDIENSIATAPVRSMRASTRACEDANSRSIAPIAKACPSRRRTASGSHRQGLDAAAAHDPLQTPPIGFVEGLPRDLMRRWRAERSGEERSA